MVFGFLPDQLNSLQHVGDVVDPPLLHLQHFSGPVQVQNAVCRLAQQPHKLFGEQTERGVVACSLARRLGCYVMKRRRRESFIYSSEVQLECLGQGCDGSWRGLDEQGKF